jgi:hypothetical protein
LSATIFQESVFCEKENKKEKHENAIMKNGFICYKFDGLVVRIKNKANSCNSDIIEVLQDDNIL